MSANPTPANTDLYAFARYCIDRTLESRALIASGGYGDLSALKHEVALKCENAEAPSISRLRASSAALSTERELHNAWRKRAEEAEAAAAPVSLDSYFGCFTGDCQHDGQAQCDAAIRAHCAELERENAMLRQQ